MISHHTATTPTNTLSSQQETMSGGSRTLKACPSRRRASSRRSIVRPRNFLPRVEAWSVLRSSPALSTDSLRQNSTSLHFTPLHSTPLHPTPLHSTPLHSTPLTLCLNALSKNVCARACAIINKLSAATMWQLRCQARCTKRCPKRCFDLHR